MSLSWHNLHGFCFKLSTGDWLDIILNTRWQSHYKTSVWWCKTATWGLIHVKVMTLYDRFCTLFKNLKMLRTLAQMSNLFYKHVNVVLFNSFIKFNYFKVSGLKSITVILVFHFLLLFVKFQLKKVTICHQNH